MHDDQSTEATGEFLLSAAQTGDSEAMYRLGSLAKRTGDPDGLAKAESWWRQAAAAGHVEAMYRLGRLLFNEEEEMDRLLNEDETGEQDPERDPRTWHRMAAEAGHLEAMVSLAWLLDTFPQGDVDLAESAAWSRRAAEFGHPVAMHDYGVSLESEHEVEPWLRRSAETGYWPAMYNLAALLLDRGDPESAAEATRWLQQSARAGDPLARIRLAELAAGADSSSPDGLFD